MLPVHCAALGMRCPTTLAAASCEAVRTQVSMRTMVCAHGRVCWRHTVIAHSWLTFAGMLT